MEYRQEAMSILQLENELNEIVRLVGIDSLSPKDRLTMEVARMLREDFLQQNAFVDTDAYSSLEKQMGLLDVILHYQDVTGAAIEQGAPMLELFDIPARNRVGRAKDVSQEEFAAVYESIKKDMDEQIAAICEREGDL